MEFEVESIVNKRLSRGKIQYQVKWLNFNRRHNRWVDLQDLNCEALIQSFENSHKIVGCTKENGEIIYSVHSNGKQSEIIGSKNAKSKWPQQVFNYLQEITKMESNNVCDGLQNTNEIDISKVDYIENVNDLAGHPKTVRYATNVGDQWHYLFEWSDGKYHFVKDNDAQRWCDLVFIYLESLAN